jgi:hypothetical protein
MNPSVADQGKAVAAVTADELAHAAREVYEGTSRGRSASPTSMPRETLAKPTVLEPMIPSLWAG